MVNMNEASSKELADITFLYPEFAEMCDKTNFKFNLIICIHIIVRCKPNI